MTKQRIILCIAISTTVCAVVLGFFALPHLSDLTAFRREQASLSDLSPFDAEALGINPDYAGWLKIDGTSVDFPVVRGSDNIKYLNTSFRGEKNIVGAIFMDYRCAGEVSQIPHIIIYGHYAGDVGENPIMFGGLTNFLDERYLEKHPAIVFMENDSLYEFKIFSARLTDINDPAYHLDFSAPGSFEIFLERNGAPPDAKQIITLSTCVNEDSDYRMIVQGMLRRIVPVKIEHGKNGWRVVTAEPLR